MLTTAGAPAGDGDRVLGGAALASAVMSVVKLALGVASGSTVVLASSADSFADAAMSGINRWGYRFARTPPDGDHPWGHGKVEGALAFGQGLMLLGIVTTVLVTAALRLASAQTGALRLDLAFAALLGSMALSGGLAIALGRAARREHSLVLEADAAHYRVDLLTNVAGLAGLGLVALSGWRWLDPLLSIGMALLLAREGWAVLRQGVSELMDEALPAPAVALIEQVLEQNREAVVGFHDLRTRRSGPRAFVEVHAVLERTVELGDAHLIVQDIARQIREVVPGARVLVHPDAEGLDDAVDRGLPGSDRSA